MLRIILAPPTTGTHLVYTWETRLVTDTLLDAYSFVPSCHIYANILVLGTDIKKMLIGSISLETFDNNLDSISLNILQFDDKSGRPT